MMYRKILMRGGFTILLAVLVAVVYTTSVWAQEGSATDGGSTSQEDKTPENPLQLVQWMIDAEGGSQAYANIVSRVLHGQLEMVGMGMTAKFTSWNAGSGMYRESMSLEGMGNFEQGRLGEIAWGIDPIQGGRLLDGVEEEMNYRSSKLHPLLRVEEDYKEMKLVGEADVNTVSCWQLDMVSNSDQKETWFVRKDNHLVQRVKSMVEAPMVGKINLTMDTLDYREIDGIMIPHRMEIEQGPQKMVMSIDRVEHNGEIQAVQFALPDTIQKLVNQRRKREQVKEEGENAG